MQSRTPTKKAESTEDRLGVDFVEKGNRHGPGERWRAPKMGISDFPKK
jgi:hypothetical protein